MLIWRCNTSVSSFTGDETCVDRMHAGCGGGIMMPCHKPPASFCPGALPGLPLSLLGYKGDFTPPSPQKSSSHCTLSKPVMIAGLVWPALLMLCSNHYELQH